MQPAPSHSAFTVSPSAPLGGDIARRAFDTAAALSVARSIEDLDSQLTAFIGAVGFKNHMLVESRRGESRLLAGRPPAEWWPHLLEKGYQRDDIVFLAAQREITPFFYSDMIERDGVTPRQQHIIGERREFGLSEGFLNPHHIGDGVTIAVALVGADVDVRDPDIRAAAHVLTSYYCLAARALLSAAATTPAITLTQRQRDCLGWVREGKSATDIGAILGISAYTVHEHVAQACARLGVRTRVQAVAAAIALRLINP